MDQILKRKAKTTKHLEEIISAQLWGRQTFPREDPKKALTTGGGQRLGRAGWRSKGWPREPHALLKTTMDFS